MKVNNHIIITQVMYVREVPVQILANIVEAMWIVIGATIGVIGTAGLIYQLLSPLTLIGSITYIATGCGILFVNCDKFRSCIYHVLPQKFRAILLER